MATPNPYTPPGSPPSVAHQLAASEQRHPYSAAIAVAVMALLGIAAMMAQWLKEGWISRWWLPHDPIITLLFCGTIGAIVGVVSIPLVAPSLTRNDWLVTATTIYGVNCALVVAYVLIKPTGLTGPLSAAAVAFIGVVGMAQMLKVRTGNTRYQ